MKFRAKRHKPTFELRRIEVDLRNPMGSVADFINVILQRIVHKYEDTLSPGTFGEFQRERER